MDKQEYKLRAAEIKSLIAKRDFFQAVKIADEIDWTRVRSVAMLCTVSDLYKVNRRYKESKELLLMAYERHPNGRMILYSLCELCIKMGEVVQAIEYYKEFVQLAPMDNGKYILQYKLYVAQDVSLEERIAVLEELKKRDYREKWGYELAYLYHRIGLVTKCVEECDELILWFSDGRYVKKAMELKMLHQPLTPAQEANYNAFVGKNAELPKQEPEKEVKPEDMDISVNVGQYDTINLQKALAESMKEVLKPEENKIENISAAVPQKSQGMGSVTSQIMAPMFQNTADMKEVFFEDKTGEMVPPVSQMEELTVQEEVIPAMAFRNVHLQKEPLETAEDTPVAAEQLPISVSNDSVTETAAVMEATEMLSDAVEELPAEALEESEPISVKEAASDIPEKVDEEKAESSAEEVKKPSQQIKKVEVSLSGIRYEVPDDATKEIPSIKDIMRRPLVEPVQEPVAAKPAPVYTADGIPINMADMLSQEYDGQISLVVPEETKLEKQITGQMNIDDVLIEWEKTKKEYEEKRKAERTQKVLEQTGNMFTEFEAKARDGILEQLEKEVNLRPQKETVETKAEELISQMVIRPEEEQKEKEITQELEELPEVEELVEVEGMPEEIVLPEITESKEEPATGVLESEILQQETPDAYNEAEDLEEVEETEENIPNEKSDAEEIERTIQKIQEAQEEIRDLTEEEKVLFAPFIQTRGGRRRFLKALDMISLAAYTGNIIVTGEGDSETVKLAKNIMKNIQMTDANFSGVIAKVSGASLNSKSIESTISKLNNGGLIIEKASGMNAQAVKKLLKALNQEQTGIVVILEDNKKAIKRMLAAYPSMATFFNAHIEIEELNNDALAEYGRQYAAHMEYSIDELGMLALQTQIEDRQTSDHIVTVSEVRELVDAAIENANRKNIGHFFDVVLGKRYDDEDMIILKEKDFI